MSIIASLKEMVGATPTYSAQDRAEARAKAKAAVKSGNWLSQILDHHDRIDAAFAAVKAAMGDTARREAQQKLALLLTAHAIAEEVAVYPAMEIVGEGDATHAYKEQDEAKVQMAMLDAIGDPMSDEYLAKLEEIRLAVVHHVMHEEAQWFPALAKAATPQQDAKATEHYRDAFERYLGAGAEKAAA